jgi:hypothetical protein
MLPKGEVSGHPGQLLEIRVLVHSDENRGRFVGLRHRRRRHSQWMSRWKANEDCVIDKYHARYFFTILGEDGYVHHLCSHNTCSEMNDSNWRKLWEERSGELYPWPNQRKPHSGVNSVDTLPESPYLSLKRGFPRKCQHL